MSIWLVYLKRLLNIISGDQTWYFLSNESTNQMQQLITGLLLVVQIPLNMFWASLCPSSGAYQQQLPLVYRRNVMIAVLLVVVGSTGPTMANSTATTTFLR